MKLFTRYNRINLLATVIIFLLSGISFYFLLRYILIGQVDEDLKIEQHEIETYVAKYHLLPEIIAVRDQHTAYTKVEQPAGRRLFHTLRLQEGNEKEKELFRQLDFNVQDNTGWYQVAVSKSLEVTDNLIQSIVTITLITILLILGASFIINRLVLQKLWQPFYDTLSAMRHFELGNALQPQFPVTRIDEFILMNETLRVTTAKAEKDYHYLKEFTENASHELQTPLAIIQSKMDILIQDEQLSEAQSHAVQGAYEAIQRLSRLNHALLLLTKIENGQYAERTAVNLPLKITDKIDQFSAMIASRHIRITTALSAEVVIRMNPLLTDIILNNLLSNAIKYSPDGGHINIVLQEGLLQVSNTAHGAPLEADRLFRRFAAAGQGKEGIGLGLPIVQQAAAVSGFGTQYRFDNNIHYFSLIENHLS